MSSIEKLFLAVLYGLYLYDCVFWIAPGQQSYTRVSASEWKQWQREPLSFTLLGRLPVLSSPFLINPGFVRVTAAATARSLRMLAKRLNALYALLTLCRLQAFLLLVYTPVLLVLHRLASLWPWLLGSLMLSHVSLCYFAIRALRSAKPDAWLTPAASLLFNPLGATRAFDLIAQAYFDQQALN